MLIWQDADDKASVADKVRQKLDYDASSGDSSWVRQYLEWSQAADANLVDKVIGSRRIKARKANAA